MFWMLFPQKNLQQATERAFEALKSQTDQQIRWLGAEPVGGLWRLPVLNDAFEVDLASGRVTTETGREVGPAWQILALHYLAVAARPDSRPPEVTFADLAAARSYADVYERRTTQRLCTSVGREAGSLRAAAARLGARAVPGGDAAFRFDVFPRLAIELVWYAPDEEFPPSATLLLPANIESYFCAEDIVVLSERLVLRLCGRPF